MRFAPDPRMKHPQMENARGSRISRISARAKQKFSCPRTKNFLQICERAHEIFCVSARIVHFGKSESAEKIRTGLNSVSQFWSQKRPELIGAILHVFAHFFSHVFRLSKKRNLRYVIFWILRTLRAIWNTSKYFFYKRTEQNRKNWIFLGRAQRKKYAKWRCKKFTVQKYSAFFIWGCFIRGMRRNWPNAKNTKKRVFARTFLSCFEMQFAVRDFLNFAYTSRYMEYV